MHRVVSLVSFHSFVVVIYLSYRLVSSVVASACRLLNVLEVIAPFKHFNKLREFVQMKLPPGFPVKLGKWSFGFTNASLKKKEFILWMLFSKIIWTEMCFLFVFFRHPRLPNHHSHSDVSGVSLRWLWPIDFYYSQRLQRRSEPLSWPLTSHAEASTSNITPPSLKLTFHNPNKLRTTQEQAYGDVCSHHTDLQKVSQVLNVTSW